MKFIASYSGGKDSIMAIYRAIKEGHTPIFLLTTYNIDKNRSFFHNIPEPALKSVADSLSIPLLLVKTSGDDYQQNFEKALLYAKSQGAEACVFGDIDIEQHRRWPTERCENTGIKPLFPLWGDDRAKVVYEFIDSGFIADITIVNTKYMSADYLGQRLTRDVVGRITTQCVDICGENGEYHTFVSDGPIFMKPVQFSYGEQIMENGYAIVPVLTC